MLLESDRSPSRINDICCIFCWQNWPIAVFSQRYIEFLMELHEENTIFLHDTTTNVTRLRATIWKEGGVERVLSGTVKVGHCECDCNTVTLTTYVLFKNNYGNPQFLRGFLKISRPLVKSPRLCHRFTLGALNILD